MAAEPTLLGGGAAEGGAAPGLESAGTALQIAGLVTKAIGGFYAAESQQYQLESDALTLDFQRTIANINARAAESDAAAILEAGRRRRSISGLQFGQQIGMIRSRTGSRGVQAGVGSARELIASSRLAAAVDAYAIDATTIRQTTAARRRAVDFRNQALIAGTSAENVRGAADTIIPALRGATTLLGGSGNVARSVAQRDRFPRV